MGCLEHLPKPPGRSLMNVRGNAASRGMTAHDRIRLTGPFADKFCRIQTAPAGKLPVGADHFTNPPILTHPSILLAGLVHAML
jgi:hypothetical protein